MSKRSPLLLCLICFFMSCDGADSTHTLHSPNIKNIKGGLLAVANIGTEDGRGIRQEFKFFQKIMGTMFTAQLIGFNQQVATSAARAAFNEVRRIEHQVSSWKPRSEIGQLNKQAGVKEVQVSYDTAWLLCKSMAVSSLTRGTFDITWAALKGLWNFKTHQLPSRKEVLARLAWVGINQLTLTIKTSQGHKKNCADLFALSTQKSPHPSWSRFSPSPPEEWSWTYEARLASSKSQIDLGGIAKGFAVDRATEVFDRLGFTDYVFDGGGDMRVSGRSLSNTPWSIGIQHPRAKYTWGKLWVPTGWSVVTSGDYERFFIIDQQRYHHIIDLRTGSPARGSVAVTVIAESALMADTLATAVFILGPREGIALVDSLSGVEALCFTPTGEVIHSQGAHVFSPELQSRWRP